MPLNAQNFADDTERKLFLNSDAAYAIGDIARQTTTFDFFLRPSGSDEFLYAQNALITLLLMMQNIQRDVFDTLEDGKLSADGLETYYQARGWLDASGYEIDPHEDFAPLKSRIAGQQIAYLMFKQDNPDGAGQMLQRGMLVHQQDTGEAAPAPRSKSQAQPQISSDPIRSDKKGIDGYFDRADQYLRAFGWSDQEIADGVDLSKHKVHWTQHFIIPPELFWSGTRTTYRALTGILSEGLFWQKSASNIITLPATKSAQLFLRARSGKNIPLHDSYNAQYRAEAQAMLDEAFKDFPDYQEWISDSQKANECLDLLLGVIKTIRQRINNSALPDFKGYTPEDLLHYYDPADNTANAEDDPYDQEMDANEEGQGLGLPKAQIQNFYDSYKRNFDQIG